MQTEFERNKWPCPPDISAGLLAAGWVQEENGLWSHELVSETSWVDAACRAIKDRVDTEWVRVHCTSPTCRGKRNGGPGFVDLSVDFTRGFFCAVACLLHEQGAVTAEIRSLFGQGGDWREADPEDIDLFRKYGLVEAK